MGVDDLLGGWHGCAIPLPECVWPSKLPGTLGQLSTRALLGNQTCPQGEVARLVCSPPENHGLPPRGP